MNTAERPPETHPLAVRITRMAYIQAYQDYIKKVENPALSARTMFELASACPTIAAADEATCGDMVQLRDASIARVGPALLKRIDDLEEAALLKGDYHDIAKELRADFPEVADRVAELALEAPEFKHEPPTNDDSHGFR